MVKDESGVGGDCIKIMGTGFRGLVYLMEGVDRGGGVKKWALFRRGTGAVMKNTPGLVCVPGGAYTPRPTFIA